MKRWVHGSKQSRMYYKVTYGWDEGGPESGPIFKSDYVIVKARSKADAEQRVYSKMQGLEGCHAELASQEDIHQFIADAIENEKEYNYLVEHGLIDPELDQEMMEAMDPDRFKKMPLAELRQYYKDFVEDSEFRTFSEWYSFLKESGSR